MKLLRPWFIGFFTAAAACTTLMYWYQWSATPLSSADVERYMAAIEAQDQDPGARHDLPALRALLESDDGKPVYTVNMYEFHDRADYPRGSGYGGTGEEAYERFSKVMISLMLERGSHPVYGSDWVDTGNSRWDRIVIVRYRSRRDLADLFATDDFADASLHKWASIKRHDRMVVQAVHIPGGEYIILPLGILLGLAAYLLARLLSRNRKA